jgi:hypothetical protein
MFAKIAKFPVAGAQQAVPDSVKLAHSNDNTATARAAVAFHRRVRTALACHWRPMSGGRHECYWVVELAERAATEEPDHCWIGAVRLRSCRLTGHYAGRAMNLET